jgi:hypothetical protein
MNYLDFYTKAREQLINSMVNLWVRGLSKEQEYLRRLLENEEPLLAEPVFQSIFPWESSEHTFAEHAYTLDVLKPEFVEALSGNKVDSEQRFPKDRHPYKHQTESWKAMLGEEGKTIVVTSGTGSGKTECFMVPVLQDLVNQNKQGAIQAIFLYPLNALMDSQRKRVAAWCKALNPQVTFAIYNGDTKESSNTPEERDASPELISRDAIRDTPPQILFTNPTMLNYMLLRNKDRTILEKSEGKLRWILLDEAHTYTGSAAAELALQLRRVLQAFNVTVDQVNFAVTSATMGDSADAQIRLKTFVSQLTGKQPKDIVIIGGQRIIPQLNEKKAQDRLNKINKDLKTSIDLEQVKTMREKLNSETAVSLHELGECFDKKLASAAKADEPTHQHDEKAREKLLQVIDALGEKVEGLNADGTDSALLPTRIHLFARSIGGVYTCVNPECKRHKDSPLPIGSLTTYQRTHCSECGAPLLEVCTCGDCRGILVTGEANEDKGFRQRSTITNIDDNPFGIELEELTEQETEDDEKTEQSADGYETFFYAMPEKKLTETGDNCLYYKVTEDQIENSEEKGYFFVRGGEDFKSPGKGQWTKFSITNDPRPRCPHCRALTTRVKYLRASAQFSGRALAEIFLEEAQPMPADKAESGNSEQGNVLYEGKKYIAFTDSRQGTATSTQAINNDMERVWLRSEIFRRLYKLGDYKREQPEEWTEKDEEILSKWKDNVRDDPETYSEVLSPKIEALEKKQRQEATTTSPKPVNWEDLLKDIRNNSASFRDLFTHLSSARINTTLSDDEQLKAYLNALIFDQFGSVFKQRSSLETMGLVHLEYPKLARATRPLSVSDQLSDQDWRDFLKLALDYHIRAYKNLQVEQEEQRWSTVNNAYRPIFPPDSTKDGVDKWPQVRTGDNGTVNLQQPRLVLLLCAALGYHTVDKLKENKDKINRLLKEAWDFLSKNILGGSEDNGYTLNLLGDNVKICISTKSYLCPVDKMLLDTVFCGYSPHLSGRLTPGNIERFHIATQEVVKEGEKKPPLCTFETPFCPPLAEGEDNESISRWLKENFKQHKEAGLYNDWLERAFLETNIYLAGEHSAQINRKTLSKREKDFNEGRLNILSCSTTMEMGVDIGGISEVVMNNVPPQSANYLQRAGRAGRRAETKCLAFTFCPASPIGVATWQNPKAPITGKTDMPLLKMDSGILIQRHINAFFFYAFAQKHNFTNEKQQQGTLRVDSQVQDLFPTPGEEENPNCYDELCTFLNELISEKQQDSGDKKNWETLYKQLVDGTYKENSSISDAAEATKASLEQLKEAYTKQIEALTGIKGKANRSMRQKALEYQIKNLKEKNLLAYLAEQNFLPSAGLPTGLVECQLGEQKSKENSYRPISVTRHLSRSILEFAPGTQLVCNEWVYEPEGIVMKTQYQQAAELYAVCTCGNCGHSFVERGTIDSNTPCPQCGSRKLKSLDGIAKGGKFTRVVEPAGFTVSVHYRPRRYTRNDKQFQMLLPQLLNMAPWPKDKDNTNSQKLKLRTSADTDNPQILFFNKGTHGHGFALCCTCGRMKAENSGEEQNNNPLGTHNHLHTGGPCSGTVLRHIVPAARYNTDFVEMRCYDKDGGHIKDQSLLRSLGVVLSRELTHHLGVNEDEVDFGYNPVTGSVFLYDTAVGGAGYSTLLLDYREEVLQRALDSLNACNCKKACTQCLIDRRSQWYIADLDRHKLIKWLETEKQSRTAPPEVTEALGEEGVTTVTTNLTALLTPLASSSELEEVRIYLDDDYEKWSNELEGDLKLLLQLPNKGLVPTFVVPKKMDINSYPFDVQSLLNQLTTQYRFAVCSQPTHGAYKPLLALRYENKWRTFYGADIQRSFGADWGEGQLYEKKNDTLEKLNYVNREELLKQLKTKDTLGFDARLKADCMLSELFQLLQTSKDSNEKEHKEDWNHIQKAIEGKEISVSYTDRYLMTPLGCMLLVRFLQCLKDQWGCRIKDVEVHLSQKIDYKNETYAVNEPFEYFEDRDNFLTEALTQCCGVKNANIQSGQYIAHERDLKISTGTYSLCLRPDAGISQGWTPNQFKEQDLDFSFEGNWDEDVYLFNKNKKGQGLLYTILFGQEKKDK